MSKITDYIESGDETVIGEVVPVPVNDKQFYIDRGYLPCDGSVALQSSYPELYLMIDDIPTADITVWTSRTSGTTVSAFTIAYSGSLYAFFGTNDIRTSTNAINWTARTSGTTSTPYTSTYGNGVFVSGGWAASLQTSTNGLNWVSRTSGTSTGISSLYYNNGLFIYGDWNGGIYTSTNAINWTARTSGITGLSIETIVYGNGLYVCGGASGVLSTSTNAINWTSRTSGTTSSIRASAYSSGLYVYGGWGGLIATSTNAINWTSRTSGTTSNIYSMINVGPYFVAGTTGSVIYSLDGIDWYQGTTVTGLAEGLVYGGSKIVCVGFGGFVKTCDVYYDYNTSTEFKLPESLVDTIESKLYVKAI